MLLKALLQYTTEVQKVSEYVEYYKICETTKRDTWVASKAISVSWKLSALKASTHQVNSCCVLSCRHLFSQSIFYFFHFTQSLLKKMFVCLCRYLIEALNDKLAASEQIWSCAGGTALSESESADAKLESSRCCSGWSGLLCLLRLCDSRMQSLYVRCIALACVCMNAGYESLFIYLIWY